MKRKIKALCLICIVSIHMVGCTDLSVTNMDKKVSDYNKLVEGTVNSYSKSVAYSEKNKESIVTDLVTDSGIALNKKYGLSRLSESEKKAFEYPMINTDEYFTALGATATREVILIVGSNKTVMNLILVWSEDELVSVERRVVKNA